jgi:hypothetical protein
MKMKRKRKRKRKSNVSRSDQGIQRMRYLVLSFVIVAAPTLARAEENAVRSYLLPEHGTFQVKVPESWKDSVAQPTGGLPPTITFTAKAGAAFKILLTPVWSAQPDLKTPTPDELKIRVQRSADEMTQRAVEKNIEVKLLKGPTNIGYYFAATDPAPKPGEFKLLNQGMIAVKDLLVAFTILTNDGQDAVVAAALSMLSGAEKQSVHAASPDPGTLQVIENNGAYELSVPISRLVMRIPKENLSPQKNPLGGSASGPRYFCFGDGKALFLSGWFESADDFKGMERFWKGETQSWSEKPKNVSFQQIGNWNIVIYDMEVPLPETSNSHIRAELVQSGTWIDLHLSLTAGQSAKDTQAELVKILKKILVVER